MAKPNYYDHDAETEAVSACARCGAIVSADLLEEHEEFHESLYGAVTKADTAFERTGGLS